MAIKKLQNITPLRKGGTLYHIDKFFRREVMVEKWKITNIKVLSNAFLDCTVSRIDDYGYRKYEHIIVEQSTHYNNKMRIINEDWFADSTSAEAERIRKTENDERIGFAVNLIAAIKSFRELYVH